MKRTAIMTLLVALAATGLTQIPEEYSITDISGWSDTQLATLPYFDRYIPLAPAGASTDLSPIARSGQGVVAAVRDPNDTLGAFVYGGGQTNIQAWGTYHWSYQIWDNNHWDYYSGNITHSQAMDVNVFGQIIGNATLSGSGSSSLNYSDHAYRRDTTTGEHLDLTPTAHRADFRGINDRGEITGRWWTTNVSHAIRRLADGTEYDFTSPGGSVSPSVINNRGVIAGMVVTYGSPAWVYHPFVSTETNAMTQLPYPPQGSPENGTIYDINDHGIIVGQVYKGSGVEKQAARWYPDNGGWGTDDLNELLEDNPDDFLLDRCVAVNDAGHMIVMGHPDADVIVSHTLLLTPTAFPKPSVISLNAISITSTSAVIRAKINACNLSTTASIQHGTTSAYGTTTAVSGTFTGTAPALISMPLTNLMPNTTYHARATATNSQGETLGEDITFTTKYDYATWAFEQFGTNAINPSIAGETADPNGNGIPNLAEYAFGGAENAKISGSIQSNRFMLSYRHPVNLSDIAHTVECTTNLPGVWMSGTGLVETVNTEQNPDGTQTVTVRFISLTEPKQYMRIRVTRNP